MADPRKDKHQAELDADCLTAMHGQRPIIFYSNGLKPFCGMTRSNQNARCRAFTAKMSCSDLTKEREDSGTRLVFSTYPTIMNCIDGTRDGDDNLTFAYEADSAVAEGFLVPPKAILVPLKDSLQPALSVKNSSMRRSLATPAKAKRRMRLAVLR